MDNVKFTHKVTVLTGPRNGSTFLCAILGNRVYVSPATTPDGEEWGDYDEYDAETEFNQLTPERWFGNPARWSVKKLVQFKGNK